MNFEFVTSCSKSVDKIELYQKHNVNYTMLKLKDVLSKLILPGFKASDDTVLQKLFDQLCCSKEEGILNQKDLLEILLPWILNGLKQWDNVSNEVRSFLFKVIGYILCDSEGFSALNDFNILSTVYSLVNENETTLENNLVLSYVGLVSNLIHYDDGKQWILNSDIWKQIYQFSIKSHSIYVKRRSQQFISEFLLVFKNNTTLMDTIIMEIGSMIGNSDQQLLNIQDIQNPCVFNNNNQITTSAQCKLDTYKLLSDILLMAINDHFSPGIIHELFIKYRIHDIAWTEIHSESDSHIILAASKLLCLWNISSTSNDINNKYSEAYFSSVVTKHLNLLIIRHLFPKVILETCVEYSSLWHKYNAKFDREESIGEFTKIENLIFLVQAMPMFICIRLTLLHKSEITELFIDKLFKVACPNIVRLCYFYRDQLRVAEVSLGKFTCQIINSFIRVSSFCEKEQAVMIFQGFMHLLKEFVHTDNNTKPTNNCNLCPDNLIRSLPDLLAALLSGLTCYLKKFKFSWRDSLETVCIMSFIQNLITNPDVPFLVCAEALKLAKLVLLYFIPPNLALLVDTLQGSSMRDLGKQLFKTLGSLYWEVRDSTLELLQVIASLSVDKFPAFQALLLEHDLPNIILSVVEADCESYVRASALSCISELVKVQIIWDTYLQKEQVLNSFLSILYFETEGIVRNNAALLIRDICKYRTLPENFLECVYDTMYHVAQNDLHWEVKMSALDFWHAIIEKCFITMGMVDRCFPEVIFSKEKKKIIQMTPNEKCERVKNVFIQLSLNGCLYTLWETLHDNCDILVQKKSALIVKELLDMAKTYDIFNELQMETMPTINNGNVLEKQNNYFLEKKDLVEDTIKPTHDDIIEEIVAENDLLLLSGLVQLNIPLKKKWPKIIRNTILPGKFLINLINSTDLNKFLEEPTLSSSNTICDNKHYALDSLLDDILLYTATCNNDQELNKNCIDCY